MKTHHLTVHSRGRACPYPARCSPVRFSPALLHCPAVKQTPPTERTIQSMALNNPPDQPPVEQITTKNNISYTSHDQHPLTGTPFSENITAIPTTPATLTTLTTLTTLATPDHPAANLACSLAIPTAPTTLATPDHSDSNFPLPLTTLEHNTLLTPPTPSAPSIPIHEEASTLNHVTLNISFL